LPLDRARAGVSELDSFDGVALGALHERMPYANVIAPRRERVEVHPTVRFALAEVRGLSDIDVRNHPVVYVAAELAHAGLVEQHGLRRCSGVERQLELLGGRERIHVVPD